MPNLYNMSLQINIEDIHTEIINKCRTIFKYKMEDYGTSWFVLRLPSITDQIMIKASRIRSIQEKKTQLVMDNTEEDFIGIINYCLMALIRLSEIHKYLIKETSATGANSLGGSKKNFNIDDTKNKNSTDTVSTEMFIRQNDNLILNLTEAETFKKYDDIVSEIVGLFRKKNHDYDGAWKKMRINSMVDIILMKLVRIKKLEDNGGMTSISEGVSSGYKDIINYAIFCLIKNTRYGKAI